MSFPEQFLETMIKRLENCKELGDKALAQAGDDDLHWRPDDEANSIAIIVQHLHGNMRSRFTDFLESDGEKPWRARDEEFEEQQRLSRQQLTALWEEGWTCVFSAVRALRPEDLTRTVVIRGSKLAAFDAVLRQLAHYNYHVGQIVYVVRMRLGKRWETLSIARRRSADYLPKARD